MFKRHLETKLPTYVNRSTEYFTHKPYEWKNELTSLVFTANSDNDNAFEASYRISYRIAKTTNLILSLTKKSIWYHCLTTQIIVELTICQTISKMKFWRVRSSIFCDLTWRIDWYCQFSHFSTLRPLYYFEVWKICYSADPWKRELPEKIYLS